ncbi:MAG: type IV secretion system DNA-binding domain-containing protein [Minisyncoccia bacterium]|jgi:hypothetical protein
MLGFYIFISIVLCAIAGTAIYFIFRSLVRRRIALSLSTSVFLIKIPKPAGGSEATPGGSENKDFKAELAHFEQLLGSLAAIKKPFTFEVAVPHVGEEIHFYLTVPKLSSEVAAKQVLGLWSGASVTQVTDDFNIFNPHGEAVAAFVKQKEHYGLPMRTYNELGIDSFEPIVGALAKINEIGEGAAVQVIIQPAPAGTKKEVQRAIERLKRGEPFKKVFRSDFVRSFSEPGEILNPKTKEKKIEEKQERVVDEEAAKALHAKIMKPLFFVNVRLVASAGSTFQANDILDGLAAGFSQFGSPTRNDLRVIKPRNPAKLIRKFIFREFDASQAMTLSSEEIASFYHLPISSTETPHVKWLKSKEAPPPENLAKQGALLGYSDFRGESRPIYITDEDRRRHIYVIGQTGTGKTTEISSMLIDDIQAGKGVAIIDPHGEFAEKALAKVPKERVEDVIYFDPSDLARPMGINMLDYNFSRPEEKTFIVNELLGIFDKLYDLKTTGGPMFELYMRNALLLLMEDMPNEEATLIEVPRIFTDTAYRVRKLERIQNPTVIDFWEKEAIKTSGEQSLANMAVYVSSKFTAFISNDYMRPIIGQPKSAFNFRDAMDNGKILLINLSKGRIGDLNANLLGMIFIGKILMAALSRVEIADESKRRDFYLYIDEFQNFATEAVATILSEARKYHLSLTMAHQFIAQLKENIRDAVFGNVGTQLICRVGPQDAEFLVKQFEPVFNKNDLISIDNLNAFVRLLVNGQTSRPFNMKMNTSSWAPGNTELAAKLKEYSRVKFGQDRQVVEDEIYRRLRE